MRGLASQQLVPLPPFFWSVFVAPCWLELCCFNVALSTTTASCDAAALSASADRVESMRRSVSARALSVAWRVSATERVSPRRSVRAPATQARARQSTPMSTGPSTSEARERCGMPMKRRRTRIASVDDVRHFAQLIGKLRVEVASIRGKYRRVSMQIEQETNRHTTGFLALARC